MTKITTTTPKFAVGQEVLILTHASFKGTILAVHTEAGFNGPRFTYDVDVPFFFTKKFGVPESNVFGSSYDFFAATETKYFAKKYGRRDSLEVKKQEK